MKINQDQTITSKTDFFYYAFRNILLVGLPLVVVSGFILSLPHSSATESASTSDQVYITLSTSCTISSELVSPHTIDINGGQHKENIGTTKIGTFCNDNNGYSIYAIGYSNNTDGNTDLIGSLGNNYNIHTGVYDSNNPSNSSWGMKLTAGVGTGINPNTGASIATTPPTIVNGYNNYNVVPNVYTLVASRASGTNMNEDINLDITGSYFTTTYDIYASSVQPAGTYVGQVKYILTHPNTNAPNTINDIDAAFAIAGKQKVYQDANGSYYAMQDMSHDICNSVTRTGAETTTQLVDIRDNKLYYVTKLKDGNCWMTQNLDLELGGTGVADLTSNNTDLSTTASGNGIYDTTNGGYSENNGVWTWTPAYSAITANHTIASNNSVSNWTNEQTKPYSVEGGNTYWYTSNTANNDAKYTSLASCATDGRTETDCKHSHAGNYYNWTAAIATNNSSGISSNYAQASNSICPKNWRLPIATNGSSNTVFEFGDLLYTAYHITTARTGSQISYTTNGFSSLRKSPLWFVRSGDVYDRTLNSSGVRGRYWSSAVISSDDAYDLYFIGTGVWPAHNGSRYVGGSIRCIAR